MIMERASGTPDRRLRAGRLIVRPVSSGEGLDVVVLGLGYVGAVTAAGLAAAGHGVVGVDVDDTKVRAINEGRSPIVEPDIDELMAWAVDSGRLRATMDVAEAVAGADATLVCVGTPSAHSGAADLTYLTRALADLRRAMDSVSPPARGHHSVVIRSTVPPGTGAELVAPMFAPGTLPAGWKVGTAMCPEFLREGSSVADFFDPPLVVIGSEDDATRAMLTRLFSFLTVQPDYVAVGTAEALKYSCNAFHAAKVSFTNELGRVFRHFGVDVREMMEVFIKDTSLNLAPAYLRPGFAYGGSCLPKDLRSLHHMARMHSVDVPLLSGTAITNELVITDLVDRVVELEGRRVAMFGLSFKADTDDLRESPNVELAERLIGKGYDLRIYDPIVNFDRLHGSNRRHVEERLPHVAKLLTTSPEAALEGADVVLVSSKAADVVQALLAAPPRTLIDLDGRLGSEVEALPGYQGIGW